MAKPRAGHARVEPESDLALPRPPGTIRRFIDRHPRLVDWTIAVLCEAPLLLIALVLPATGTAGPADVAATLAAGAIGFVALVLRRRFPLAGTVAVAAVAFVLALLPLSTTVGGWLDLFVMLYSLGVHSTTRRMWAGYAVASAGAILSGVIVGLGGADATVSPLATTIGTPMAIFYLVPTLIGMTVGGRRRYIAAIIARAQDLARERDQRARLAVTEERARVAREMHDIVSHGLTVMVTLSEGAAAQAEVGAPGAPDAMRRVATAGRDALADMRRLLGLLRDPDAPAELAPQPTSGDMDELIEGFRGAGVPVRWTRSGQMLTADEPGRPDIPLAAYRILQEGLTNVLRHAPGAARVDASLDNTADEVVIVIENSRPSAPARGLGEGEPAPPAGGGRASGAPHRRTALHDDAHAGARNPGAPSARRHEVARRGDAAPEPRTRGAGRGLIGARERAALHGGTLEAGATPQGGWRLRAVLRKDHA